MKLHSISISFLISAFLTSLPGLANVATAGNIFTYKKSIPGSATKTVSLTSTVTAIADKIDTSVDNIDFGTIMANSNVQGKSFMDMNTGNTVYTPQFSVTPGFTFEHSCFNLYPQNTCWVTVHTLASYSNPNGTLIIKGVWLLSQCP